MTERIGGRKEDGERGKREINIERQQDREMGRDGEG